jgi:hypothetical protein
MEKLEGEKGYSSYSFLNSALGGVSGQRHASAALYPRGKDRRNPLDRRLGGTRGRSGLRGRNIKYFALSGIVPSRSVSTQTLLSELHRLTDRSSNQQIQ